MKNILKSTRSYIVTHFLVLYPYLSKVMVALGTLFATLIPVYTFLFINHALQPVGFWQKLAIVIVCLWFLGGLQVFLLAIWFKMIGNLFLKED